MEKEKTQYFLKGEHIGMRALCLEDIGGNYNRWFNDEEVCFYNSHHRFPMNQEMLASYIKGLDNSRCITLAVEILKDKIHIGNISLQNINYIDRNAEIAFLFGEKEYWGKGYAEEAAKLLINHAFLQLGLIRIYFGTSCENIAMQRLGEKLKFVKEGIRRKAIFKNGVFYDIYEYGLIKE